MIHSIMRDYYGRVRPRLILLEIDDELAARRAFSRTSKGRFNDDSSPQQQADFGRWLSYHRELVSLLPSDLDVTRVDGISRPELLAAHIRDYCAV